MHRHVIVVSHRRSGTHLTIDTLINNFCHFSNQPKIQDITIDRWAPHIGNQQDIGKLSASLDLCPCVMKSHSHRNFERFFGSSQFIEELFATSKIIYVHRDGRDVMVSLYHYIASFKPEMNKVSFSDFLCQANEFDNETYDEVWSRVQYWKFHVESWLDEKDVFVLSFRDISEDFENTLNNISEFLDMPLSGKIINPRITSNSDSNKMLHRIKKYLGPSKSEQPVKRTTVEFRKGESGDWKTHFSELDLKLFEEIAGELQTHIGYKFV